MSGAGYKDRPPDDVKSRRIGWRAASRLLDGQDGGRGTEDVRTLITLASVPMYAITARTAPAEREAAPSDVKLVRGALHDAPTPGTSPLPDALLAAFRESAAVTPTQTVEATAVRRQPATRAVILRFGAAVLVVCGAGTAAASVGVLPTGMQRIAHEFLGVGRVPAPSKQAPSSNAATSRRSTGNSSQATTPTTGAASPSMMISLCRQLPPTGDVWGANLNAADRATLIAAAGDEHKVKAYCARLLSNASDNTVPDNRVSNSTVPNSTAPDNTVPSKPVTKGKPSPSGSAPPPPRKPIGKPSPAPKAKATETHGGPPASHAPPQQIRSSGPH